MSLPADADDVSWVKEALVKKTARITVREKSETIDDGEEESKKSVASEATINMEAFLRP